MLPIIYIGFSSLIIQIIILRELLSIFSGNELDIGITLSLWLIFVGIGSLLGKKVSYRYALPFSFLTISLLLFPTILGIKFIRHFLSIDFGEIISLGKNILFTVLILFPICSVIGIQFPLAVSFVKGKMSAGKVYGLESIGAFAGGVSFTFFISQTIDVVYISVFISIVNILVFLILTKKKEYALFFLLPILFIFIFKNYIESKLWHSLNLVMKKESRYGEIVVLRFGDQFGVYMNNHLLFTYLDSVSEENKAHIIMTIHKDPEDILCIGGSLGVVREILKYPVNHIDFIEMDPRLIEVSTRILYNDDIKILKDKRLNIINEDGRRFIEKHKNRKYDLVILNISAPSTASLNRFYTVNFFKDVKKILKEEGIFSLWLQRTSGYMGRSMQIANGSIYNSLKNVFKYVELSSQEYGGYFSSDRPLLTDPVLLENRFQGREISTTYFQASIFHDFFSEFGVEYVKNRLKDIKSLNTDLKPSAYLYNLLLWAEIQGFNINYLLKVNFTNYFFCLSLILFFIIIFSFNNTKKVVSYSVFTTGFSSMVFTISLILLYQSLYGYIYEMIGLLTATFMFGIWIGTNINYKTDKSIKMLLIFEFFTILISLIMLFVIKHEVLFYIIMLFCGFITGVSFKYAFLALKDVMFPGILYAIDLFGSFLGSILTTLVVIPLLGVLNALLTITVIKIVSVLLLSFIFFLTENHMNVVQKEVD